MAMRTIAKDEFRKVLDTLFPWGYTGDVEKWETEWFLGWAYINQNSQKCNVMCVNVEGGGIVFWLIHYCDVTPDMVTGAIDGMMHALLPGMITTCMFDEDHDVVLYKFVDDGEDMTDKEINVRDIVQGILDKDNQDYNVVTDVFLDDGGKCLHVTFSGGVEDPTIKVIGEEFGDPEPNVYGAGQNAVRLVIINNTHTELID